MRKARQGGATPEKGVASGKLLFQRRSGAKANHSSLAICKAHEVLLRVYGYGRVCDLSENPICRAGRGERQSARGRRAALSLLRRAAAHRIPNCLLPGRSLLPAPRVGHGPRLFARSRGAQQVSCSCVYLLLVQARTYTYCIVRTKVETRVHSCMLYGGDGHCAALRCR